MDLLRRTDLDTTEDLLRRHRVVGLIGARQVGKSTLAATVASRWAGPVHRFDLEDPADLARLADPMLALRPLEGLVVLDEIQRLPDVFPVLRVLADRRPLPARFLVLGSASPALLRQSAESLAGRIAFHELGGLRLGDVGSAALSDLWHRGGLPDSFLAADDRASHEHRLAYLRLFLERDLPQLGVAVAAPTMRRFWTMLAHAHGQIWNASDFARSFGVADTTVRNYLDHLAAALVVRLLAPWHENLAKRQVRSPKVYLADTGLLHALLNLPERADVEAHPRCGASWEGFLIDQVSRRLGARPEECHFWATHGGAELDLLVVRGRHRIGFEMKRTVSPRTSRSTHIALADLRLDRLDIVHAGDTTFPISDRIRALSAHRLDEDLERL